MQIRIIITPIVLAFALAGCTRSQSGSNADRQHQSAAEAVGKFAYKANKEAEKAAAAAGRQIKKSAVEAHKGYKEAQRQDHEKAKEK